MNIAKRLALLAVFALAVVWSAMASGGGEQVTAGGAPMKISWMYPQKTSWYMGEVAKKFGVQIEGSEFDIVDTEKYNLKLSTGEMPDTYTGSTYKLFDEGVIRSFSRAAIEKNMPGYTKLLTSVYPAGWLANRVIGKPDQYLGITRLSGNAADTMKYTAFRADWARNVGIELPEYDQKKHSLDKVGKVYWYEKDFTLDWFEKLLMAYRDGDPKKNGQKVIPFSASQEFDWTWSPVAGAFGVAQGFSTQIGGTLYDWAVSPAYKDFLKLAAKWYKQQLIDREFATLPLAKAWEKQKARTVAVCVFDLYGINALGNEVWGPSSMASDDETKNGAEVAVIPAPIGPGGKQGARAYSPVGVFGAEQVVNVKVNDEKLAKILQILDYCRYADDQAYVMSNFGQPEVDFTWDGEPWNSAAQLVPQEKKPAGALLYGNFPSWRPQAITPSRFRFQYYKPLAELWARYIVGPEGDKRTIRPYRWDFLNETKIADINRRTGAARDTQINEFYYKAVRGEVDIDAQWDAYVAEWRRLGGDEYLAELAKCPLVSELQKGKLVY